MNKIKILTPGLFVAFVLAIISKVIVDLMPNHIISAGVIAMLLGMALFQLFAKDNRYKPGFDFVSKRILKLSIILMGASLSFSQVFEVGKYSLIVMTFTLIAAFGFGNLFGKLFKMNWKLSNLISAGTGICGGSAIAAIAPTIDAEDGDVAYAISATFIFDIIMVILFPIMGRFFQMTDLGFGLWAGTAVNDTSSVVAAAYAFSDIAGNYAVIVKLTRTLSIVPVVLLFSYINQRIKLKESKDCSKSNKVNISKIFPWFIVFFLVVVGFKSSGFINDALATNLTTISKFMMIMSLGAIGLKTDFKKVSKSGFMPMVHGFIISLLVVVVSFVVQLFLNQI